MKKVYRIRREMKEFYGDKPRRNIIYSFWENIVLIIFRLRISRIKSGSQNWHILQDKISVLPTDGLGYKKRCIFYESTLKSCGEKLLIYPFTSVHFPQNLSIGNNVKLNRGVFITATTDIKIGDNVMIGPYTIINSGNHVYNNPCALIQDQGHIKKPIEIEDDVWIGSNVSILAGVKIGKGTVIGAGAVVNKSIPEFCVAVGVPAKVIKRRQ